MKEIEKQNYCSTFLLMAFSGLLLFQLLAIFLILHETHWLGPVQDFWGTIPYLDKTLKSRNWFGADLWFAQNNHRLVLPRLAFLIDYQFFGGSNIFLSGLGAVLILFEIVLVFFLLNTAQKHITETRLKLLAATCILTLPLVTYNLLHTFNTQWLECAFLALMSCLFFGKGLAQKNTTYLLVGIFAAITCNFTTFTLTSIWPSLLLLLFFYRAPKQLWLAYLGFVFCFASIFILVLPTDNIVGGQYELTPLIGILSTLPLLQLIRGFISYLISYLSLPDCVLGSTTSIFLTIASLLWFIVRTTHLKKNNGNAAEITCLSLIFFCICLGLTTAIGRASMGDVGLGPRFGPIVLLYWCAFWIAILSGFTSNKQHFLIASLVCFLWLCFYSVSNAANIGKRLAEDYNRFSKSQMAYMIDMQAPNAIYENMVPEWRNTSYPGMMRAIPVLKENQWGIFSLPIAKYAKEKLPPAFDLANKCGSATLSQKTRNNDTDVYSFVLESTETIDKKFPYALIYDGENLIAAGFRKRNSPFKSILKNDQGSIWWGISKIKIDSKNIRIFIFGDKQNACSVDLVQGKQ